MFSGPDPIGRRYDFDFRYSASIFFVRRDEIETDCEFTNIRVVASKKKGNYGSAGNTEVSGEVPEKTLGI